MFFSFPLLSTKVAMHSNCSAGRGSLITRMIWPGKWLAAKWHFDVLPLLSNSCFLFCVPWRQPFLLPFHQTVSQIFVQLSYSTTVSKPYRNLGQQKVIGVLGIWPKIRTHSLLQIQKSLILCHHQKTCLLNLHRPRTAPDSSLTTRQDAAGNSWCLWGLSLVASTV